MKRSIHSLDNIIIMPASQHHSIRKRHGRHLYLLAYLHIRYHAPPPPGTETRRIPEPEEKGWRGLDWGCGKFIQIVPLTKLTMTFGGLGLLRPSGQLPASWNSLTFLTFLTTFLGKNLLEEDKQTAFLRTRSKAESDHVSWNSMTFLTSLWVEDEKLEKPSRTTPSGVVQEKYALVLVVYWIQTYRYAFSLIP